MKIRFLDIRGFGKYVNRKITPSPGFNMVFGSNESGKSTLVAFIEAMLFGIKATRRVKKSDRTPEKSYKPWNSDTFSGIMEYALDDGSVFRIDRNFDKGTAHIRDDSAVDLSEHFALDRDAGPQFAEAHLGLNAAVYQRSALIRQMSSAVDEAGREALLERLSNLNASGAEDQSLSKAVNALSTALLEKVGTGRTTTRPLDRILIRLAELEKERAFITGENERYLDTFLLLKAEKEKLKTLRLRFGELTECRDALTAGRLTEIAGECREIEEDLNRMHSERSDLAARLEKETRFDEMTELSLEALNASFYEYLETTKRIAELNQSLKRLRERLGPGETQWGDTVLREERTGRKERAASVNEKAASEAAAGTERRKRPLSIIVAVLFLAISLTAFVFSFLLPDGVRKAVEIASGFLLLASLAALAALLVTKRRTRNGYSRPDVDFSVKDGLSGTDSGYMERQAELSQLCERVASLEARKSGLLGKLGMFLGITLPGDWEADRVEACVEAFKTGYREYRDAHDRLHFLENDVKVCRQRLDSLFREASALAKKEIRRTEDMPGVVSGLVKTKKGARQQNDFIFGLEEQIRKAGDALRACEMEVKALETRLEKVPPIDALAAVEEETALLLERKASLETAGQSLTLAIEILKEVSRNLRKNYTPEINRVMGEMLSLITGGRYTGISTGPNLEISLETPETVELVPVGSLSGATVDQVYFAMRLAVIKLIERGGETLPVILDEPFSQYDETRVYSVLHMLKKISADHQVFFLTCRKRELDIAREIWSDELNLITL